MTQEQLKEYFKRIEYTPGDEPEEEILRRLHIGHITHIPYENLDPYRGIPVTLEEETLFDKQVIRRRGGFCFEMNGMFAAVLKTMGFDFKRVSARLDLRGTGFGPYLHCAAIVNAGGKRYLADVGCGSGGFAEPILLEPGLVQTVKGGTYRVLKDERFGYVIQWKRTGSEELTNYMSVQDVEALPQDFDIGAFFASTHPNALHTFSLMIAMTLPTLDGKVTLNDDGVRIVRNGEEEHIPLSGVDEINAACLKYFGLDAPIEEIKTAPVA